jgi:hypothetical protein
MNKLHTYPITNNAKKVELNVMKSALHTTYNTNQIKKHYNSQTPIHKIKKTKWATFTYSGKETRTITKLFKETHIKIAYRTRNTRANTLKLHPQTDKYVKSGIYEMKCQDCPLKYTGQMGRTLHTR